MKKVATIFHNTEGNEFCIVGDQLVKTKDLYPEQLEAKLKSLGVTHVDWNTNEDLYSGDSLKPGVYTLAEFIRWCEDIEDIQR